jgi:hypothetical protein
LTNFSTAQQQLLPKIPCSQPATAEIDDEHGYLRTLVPALGPSLKRRLSELHSHIARLLIRLDLPPMSPGFRFPNIASAEERVSDLNQLADHIIAYNAYYEMIDDLFDVEDISAARAKMLELQQIGPPSYPKSWFQPHLPLHRPPTSIATSETNLTSASTQNSASSAQLPSVSPNIASRIENPVRTQHHSTESPNSLATPMAAEPRLNWSFMPTTTRSGRATKPNSKHFGMDIDTSMRR